MRIDSHPSLASSYRRWLVAAAAAAFTLVSAASAPAAVTIGSDLSSPGLQDNCNPAGCQETVQQTVLPGRQVTAPSDGVIVRWRVRSTTGDIQLRVLRSLGGDVFSNPASSGMTTSPGVEVQTFPTRLPVNAGDYIAIDAFSTTTQLAYRSAPAAKLNNWYPERFPDGGTAPREGGVNDFEIMLNADVESDADLDGFGDESQDNCPTLANPDQADADRDGKGDACTLPCFHAQTGTPRSDVLNGGPFGDRLVGLAGHDRLSGLAGDDCLAGGNGRDRLSGGDGTDALAGGRGRDRLNGGKGKDSFSAGAGAGNDAIRSADGVKETVKCGGGDDAVRADRKDRPRGCEHVRRS